MKKTLLSLAVLLLTLGAALASQVQTNTSCGKTVIVGSSGYGSAQELVDAATAIDKVLCP